jgi:hypothetical protein
MVEAGVDDDGSSAVLSPGGVAIAWQWLVVFGLCGRCNSVELLHGCTAGTKGSESHVT